MLVGLLLVALYTALSLGSARQPGLPSLSPGDRRTLHAEYFLQSLFQNIASQPKILLAKVRSTELANLAQTHLTETRTKRAARGPPPNPCTTSEGENQLDQHCCLDTVEIDFHQIGWNFILSPRKIQYSFCRGSCNPQVIRPALFTRAASQILYKLHQRGEVRVGEPCCSPAAHNPLEIVFLNRTSSITTGIGPEYYDVSLITLEEALVTRCNCA